MRIALLGTRGIPANYGGFETFAEELSVRLVERGHYVTVYCRQQNCSDEYRGVHLRHLPTVRHKYFDTVVHTALSTLDLLLHGLARRFDVILYCNAANAIFALWPRLLGMPTLINVDGVERHRKKWNRIAKEYYRLSEWIATWSAARVITDAGKIREYYYRTYGKDSTFIPYGAEVGAVPESNLVRALGLEPGKYVLYVSRLEPENNALLVRRSFERVESDFKLVIVGDAPYADVYIQEVKRTGDERILFPGAIYGEGYKQLQSHCHAYVQATEVGGTHPALIEAMGRGALVLYLDTPESREVAGDAAIRFESADLPEKLQWAVGVPRSERDAWGQKAMRRVEALYSWKAVTDAYEELFRSLL